MNLFCNDSLEHKKLKEKSDLIFFIKFQNRVINKFDLFFVKPNKMLHTPKLHMEKIAMLTETWFEMT